jgi:hypothetical protein
MPRRDCDPVTAPRHSPALHCATPRCNVSCWALPASCSSTVHAPRGGARRQNAPAHASPLREYCQGTPYWRVLPPGAARVLACAAAAARPRGRACGAVVRRRVFVRRFGQQRVPGGLRADRGRGGVPHCGHRRGQDLWFRGDRPYLPAGLLLLKHPCVLQHARGRRRLLRTAAVRFHHHRCAASMRAAALRRCAADARQRRCGGAVWARAVCVYVPRRSRALEGTARYSRAACMHEWLMYMYIYIYVYIYIYTYTDIYTVI